MHMAQGGMPHAGAYGMSPYGPFAMHAAMMPGMGSLVGGPGSDAVVKMRGLPYKVTRNDILDFFTGLSVPLNGVHLMFNEREQPTGEAYVEFSSPEDRERAMAKDRQHIGGRYVELFRVNRAEMIAALEQFVGGYMNNQLAMGPGGMGGQAYGRCTCDGQSPYGQPPAFGVPPMGGAPGAYGAMQQHYAVGPGQMQGGGGGGHQKMNAGTLRMRGILRSTVDDVLRFFNGSIMPTRRHRAVRRPGDGRLLRHLLLAAGGAAGDGHEQQAHGDTLCELFSTC